MGKDSALRLLDVKHRLSIPADFAKQLNWKQTMKVSVEALSEGKIKLLSTEIATQRATALKEQLAETEHEEDILAALSDRFREATFYAAESRVTLPTEVHAFFDLNLVPVNVLVELRTDGVMVWSHAQRLSRLKQFFD